jgi:hypothetical protein
LYVRNYFFTPFQTDVLTLTKPFPPSQREPNKSAIMSAFDTAVADSKKLTSKPSNDDLLMLYGMHMICGW